MKTSKFDLTIDVLPDEVSAEVFSTEGDFFLREIAANSWNPQQIMANLPPSIRLGVRTSTRKKFVLVPPHSLH